MSFLYPIKRQLLLAGKRLMPRVTPSFLIIGAQKCGTTSLFHYLSNHPSLVTPALKELDFFDSDNRFARGISFYHSYFPVRSPLKLFNRSYEATPSYMGGLQKAEKAAARMKLYNPDLKLVAILRNPVDRAYSAWRMYRRNYRKDPDWFFRWMERDDSSYIRSNVICRPQNFGKDFATDIQFDLQHAGTNIAHESPILEWGSYGAMLNLYRSQFPAKQLHVLFLEDLQQYPGKIMETLTEFLQLRPHDWSRIPFKAENIGDRLPPISDSIRSLLADYYKQDVALLANLVKSSPPWPEFKKHL